MLKIKYWKKKKKKNWKLKFCYFRFNFKQKLIVKWMNVWGIRIFMVWWAGVWWAGRQAIEFILLRKETWNIKKRINKNRKNTSHWIHSLIQLIWDFQWLFWSVILHFQSVLADDQPLFQPLLVISEEWNQVSWIKY